MGLASLRPSEAARLQWKKISLELGAIEISGKVKVEVKNKYALRAIPVCDRVQEALYRAWEFQGGDDVGENDYVVRYRKPYVDPDGKCGQFGRVMSEALRAWEPKLGWYGYYLRKCVQQFAMNEDIDSNEMGAVRRA